jgi:hypothetical protein
VSFRTSREKCDVLDKALPFASTQPCGPAYALIDFAAECCSMFRFDFISTRKSESIMYKNIGSSRCRFSYEGGLVEGYRVGESWGMLGHFKGENG